MSTYIDKERAAYLVNQAEETISGAGAKYNKLINDIHNLSMVVKGQESSNVYKTMEEFYEYLRNSGGGLRNTFGSGGFNEQLINTINITADDLNDQTYSFKPATYTAVEGPTPIASLLSTGIGDLNDVANIVQSYTNDISELGEVLNSTIDCYRNLYNEATEHDVIQNLAHSAAEAIRTLERGLNEYLNKLSKYMNEHIAYWAQKQGKQNVYNEDGLKKLYKQAENATISIPESGMEYLYKQ